MQEGEREAHMMLMSGCCCSCTARAKCRSVSHRRVDMQDLHHPVCNCCWPSTRSHADLGPHELLLGSMVSHSDIVLASYVL